MRRAETLTAWIVCFSWLAACQERSAPVSPTSPPKAAATAAPTGAPSAAPSVAPPSAPPPPAPPSTKWADLEAAETACADCHPDQADAWLRSKMGRSLLKVAGKVHAPFQKATEVKHPLTGLSYQQAAGKFTERAGPGRELVRAPAFVMGSGTHAYSYLWAAEDQLYQLPLTWYTDRKAWGLSPGYEVMADHPGFFREVTVDCLNCHTDPVAARAGTRNRLEAFPEGPIGCSRCHGDSRAHAAARLEGKSAPIVVPSRLEPARAADVCAVCHFGGAVRVLRAGRKWGDFLPGDKLSEVAAIFTRQTAGQGFGTTDHFSRLAQSACASGTPTMTCATCHAPHPTHAKRDADRSQACRSCHSTGATPAAAAPAGPAAARPCKGPNGKDCASCHMDTGPARNIPHVTAVDHFIRVKPEAAPPKNNDSPLVWTADPQPEPRDPDHQILLGSAYVQAWRSDRQPRDAERAERFLTQGLAALPNRTDGWVELTALRRLQGNAAGEKDAAERALASAPEDRRVLTAVGAARMAAGDPTGALSVLDRAAALSNRAETETLRARALQMLGQIGAAREAALRATTLQPSYAEAWLALGLLTQAERKPDAAVDALTSAAAWNPNDLRAWLNLGQAEAARGRHKESLAAFERALPLAVKDKKARGVAVFGQAEALIELGEMAKAGFLLDDLFQAGVRVPGMPRAMGRVFLDQGNFREARGALEAAAQITPEDPVVWEALAVVRREVGQPGEAEEAKARARVLREKKR